MQRATSATSSKKVLQRVANEFLQRATFATSNEWILQRATSATSNERILKRERVNFYNEQPARISQRVTSYFLQRATSATSNERILQRVTNVFTTSNEQRVNLNK